MYKLTLKMAGISYKTEAETILEALTLIPLSWEQIKAKGEITLIKGTKKHEHLVYLRPLRRCFANKSAMMLLSKRLELLLQ